MARSPGGPMGGMDTGLSTIVPVDKSNNTDIASIEKQIRELTKQADRLRAQVAEEVSVKNLGMPQKAVTTGRRYWQWALYRYRRYCQKSSDRHLLL